MLELIDKKIGIFSVSYHFGNREDNFSWMFIRVYGLVMNEEKENFWNELGDIRGLWNDPWYVGGDFNVIRF